MRAASQRLKRPLIVQRTPILVDLNKFHTVGPAPAFPKGDAPQFVWCGGVDEYPKDIDFLIRVLGNVLRKGVKCRLTIVGSVSECSVGVLCSTQPSRAWQERL